MAEEQPMIASHSREQLMQHLKINPASAQLKNIKDKVEDAGAQRKRGQPTQQPDINDKFGLNQAEQERLFQIRKSFQVALNRLSSNDTKEVVRVLFL